MQPTDQLSPSRLARTAYALTIVLLLAAPAQAQKAGWPDLNQAAAATGGGEKDAALLIGIEDYRALDHVKGARANIEAWETWLRKTRGVPQTAVIKVLDDDAEFDEIGDKADAIAGLTKPNGTLWVIFVGHGLPAKDGKEGLLVGHDAKQNEHAYGHSIAQSALLKKISAGKQLRTILILDSCFSGRDRGSEIVKGAQPLLVISKQKLLPKTVTILSAGTSDQFANQLHGADRPAFSYLMLGALRGWADEDNNGAITIDEALSFTRGALAKHPGVKQTPQVQPLNAGATVLVRSAGEPPPDLDALLAKSSAAGAERSTGPRDNRENADAPPPAAGDPQQVLAQWYNQMNHLRKIAHSPTELRASISQALREVVDYTTIARTTLDAKWNGLSEDQKHEFTSALTEMLNNHYVARLEQRQVIQIENGGVNKLGNGKVRVMSTITLGRSSSDVEIALLPSSEKWLVCDVTVDGASLVLAYRSAFRKILEHESWSTLIERMRQVSVNRSLAATAAPPGKASTAVVSWPTPAPHYPPPQVASGYWSSERQPTPARDSALARSKAAIDKAAQEIELLAWEVQLAGNDKARANASWERYKLSSQRTAVESQALSRLLTAAEKQEIEAYGKAKLAPLMGKLVSASAAAQRL